MFEINVLVQQWARFVKFPYLRGLVKKITTTNIYFVRPEEKSFKYALKHFFMNLNFSLRVFPYGPIYAIESLYFLIKGGKDYTFAMLEDLNKKTNTYNNALYDLYDLNSLREF